MAIHQGRTGLVMKTLSTSAERIHAFDGLKALALVCVMAYHFFILTPNGQPGHDIIVDGFRMMNFGLTTFFVISGYLITRMLLKYRASEGFLRTFYLRHYLRLLPLYLLFLLALLVVIPATGLAKSMNDFWLRPPSSEISLTLFWALMSNLYISLQGGWTHRFLDVTWSLAVQEQFYLFWPFVVLLLSPRKLAIFCVALCGASFLFRTGVVMTRANPIIAYVFTVARIDILATGSLAAILQHEGVVARGKRLRLFGLTTGSWALLLLGSYIGLCIFSRLAYPRYALHWGKLFYMYHPIIQTFGFTVINFAGFAGILWLIEQTGGKHPVQRFLCLRQVGGLGRWGYPAYLLHLPLGFFAIAVAAKLGYTPANTVASQALHYVITFSSAITASALVHRFFEQPMDNLRHGFTYARPVDKETSGEQEGTSNDYARA